MPIIDVHTHIYHPENSHEALYTQAKRLGYAALNVLSLQSCGYRLQNLICALCKHTHPGHTYAFGGLDYESEQDFVTQAKNLRDMGFDGMKMLEAKPAVRQQLHKALDDPAYDAYYDYLEETAFPVLFHVADPVTFWNRELIPSWAMEQGWFYDESYVPYEQYYVEVENMLRKHPRLRAVFAHFFFLSGEPERIRKFLDDHPHVWIDVTAGIEMYEDFSKKPEFWRDFFVEYQDRIIFGTDSTDEPPAPETSGDGEKVTLNGYAAMEIDFLTHASEIKIYDMTLNGLGLPEETRARILSENFLEYAGAAPRVLHLSALKKDAAYLRSSLKDEKEIAQLDALVAQLA